MPHCSSNKWLSRTLIYEIFRTLEMCMCGGRDFRQFRNGVKPYGKCETRPENKNFWTKSMRRLKYAARKSGPNRCPLLALSHSSWNNWNPIPTAIAISMANGDAQAPFLVPFHVMYYAASTQCTIYVYGRQFDTNNLCVWSAVDSLMNKFAFFLKKLFSSIFAFCVLSLKLSVLWGLFLAKRSAMFQRLREMKGIFECIYAFLKHISFYIFLFFFFLGSFNGDVMWVGVFFLIPRRIK